MARRKGKKFGIVIDTREQTPWGFEGYETERRGLKEGDYSIIGYEDEVRIERKSVPDIVGTISRRRRPFERELERLQAIPYTFVLIEGSWATTQKYCASQTQYNPKSLDNSILTFQMRYPRTQWLWRPNRYYAAVTAEKLFDLFYRKFRSDLA